jgi:SAM-dependent methyltransferase
VRARDEAAAMGVQNVSLVAQDVARLPPEPKFDLVTAFDAIHDQADPARVLRRIREALAPEGLFLMLEPHASSRLEDNLSFPLATFLSACRANEVAYGRAYAHSRSRVWMKRSALPLVWGR